MSAQVLGVIGGSGLYALEGLQDVREVALATPFGEPSDVYVTGTLGGTKLVFLPRHGRGHRISPTEINSRANIWGLKALGATRVLSLSAVGSLREDIVPGDFVAVDQFIDRTRHRPDTFFERGVVAHVLFADPTCADLRTHVGAAAREVGLKVHEGGTYVNMEGPQFSTRAESRLYRSWGADVIGMTNLQEARLAREAELCYSTLAMATDYDCWHESGDVTVEAILAVMARNVAGARRAIAALVPRLPPGRGCPCQDALRFAILTEHARIPAEARDRLGLFLARYLDRPAT
ncbi:MAG: S-methyl-5'-thioadenosine phosphorylase [Planctomycetes bacterium]|nr:S-methyl-5'-thioadenosine phosphorylase [Planctomycetota bacterium]